MVRTAAPATAIGSMGPGQRPRRRLFGVVFRRAIFVAILVPGVDIIARAGPMHEMTVRVYYEDTDLAGVVYYANYLRFIERGRSEALRAIGIDQVALKEAGLVFVVRRLGADYLAPARYDDVLAVRTGIDWVKGASAAMVQEVWRGGERLFLARVTIACMDLAGRPRRLPTEVRTRLVEMGES